MDMWADFTAFFQLTKHHTLVPEALCKEKETRGENGASGHIDCMQIPLPHLIRFRI